MCKSIIRFERLADTHDTYSKRCDNLISQLSAKYRFLKKLQIASNFAYSQEMFLTIAYRRGGGEKLLFAGPPKCLILPSNDIQSGHFSAKMFTTLPWGSGRVSCQSKG